MFLRRAVLAFVCSGLPMVAMVVDLHGPACAAETDNSEPPVEEPSAAPTPPGQEPAEPPEPPEDPSAATEGIDATEPLPSGSDVPETTGLPPAAEEPDAGEASASEAVDRVVQVVVMGPGNSIRRIGSGFVVEASHVVTAAHVVEDEDRISVVVPSEDAGPELVARVRHVERYADLALLHVGGLELDPLVLAKDGFDVGRTVVSIGFPDTADLESVLSTAGRLSVVESRGAVGEHSLLPATRDDAAVELLHHNAMIDAAGYGGPLLNDCGEVVGVNRGAPGMSQRALRRGEPPEGVVYASTVTAIVALLQQAGETLVRTDVPCADPRVAAQTEVEEARRAEDDAARRAEEKEAEATAKQAELDRAREELESADAHVEDLERRLEEAERTGAEGTEALRFELEEARGNQQVAQQRVDGLEEEVQALNRLIEDLRDKLEREAQKGRQNLVITIVVAVAAVLLLAIVAGVLYRRRSLELAYARQQAAGGLPPRMVGTPPATTAHRRHTTHSPDHLLTGSTGDGQTVSLKVPGSMLSSGVVIGRSPRNVTYLIDDKTLSREHARLSSSGDGGLGIEDLGTTNGTRVNGRDLQPGVTTTVRDGDVLDLGAVTLRVARQR